MKSHFWLPLVFALTSAGVVQAQAPFGPGAYGPGPYGAAGRVDPTAEAAATLREGMDKMLAFVGAEDKPNKLQVAAFLDKEIAPYFDFQHMAKWVAGPRYTAMNEEQREAMAAALEARFLSALTGKLAGYEGQQIRFLRPRLSPRGTVSVSVGILRPGAYPSKLDFRMYRGGDGWKVYDVVANGRSAVAYYRTQFNRPAGPGAATPYGR